MPRRKAPPASRSLFASLPHELRETIRLQGVLPSAIRPNPYVSFTELQPGRDRGANAGGSATQGEGMEVERELVRTQPDSDESSSEEEEEVEEVEERPMGRLETAVVATNGASAGSSTDATGAPKANGTSTSATAAVPAPTRIYQSSAVPASTIYSETPLETPKDTRKPVNFAVKSVRTEGVWVPADDYDPVAVVPRKKRRRNGGAAEQGAADFPNMFAGHPYDCTGLVERYGDYREVPADIRKYFAQRHLMFAEYDELPLLLDHTGWFSVTPQPIAQHIAERCRCDVIVDAFCGIGGNTIEFAKTCERVIAIDNDLTRLQLARHNALQYGVADRIEFIHGSYVDFARSYAASDAPEKQAIDVVFLSPPWGGVDYLTFTADPLPFPPSPAAVPSSSTPSSAPSKSKSKSQPRASTGTTKYPLSAVEPIHGADLFHLTAALTPNIAYYLPKNTTLQELSELAPPLGQMRMDGKEGKERTREWVEVEEEWVGEKVKAVTAYYGSLVSEAGMGQ